VRAPLRWSGGFLELSVDLAGLLRDLDQEPSLALSRSWVICARDSSDKLSLASSPIGSMAMSLLFVVSGSLYVLHVIV